MSMDKVSALVEQIGSMGLDRLRETWEKRYGASPSLQSVPIMRMMLA
jgi:hypothetical protein